jgi:hypothetical protein
MPGYSQNYDPRNASFNIGGYIKYVNKAIPDNLVKFINPQPQATSGQTMLDVVKNASKQCSQDTACNGFIAYVQKNRIYYRLLQFDPTIVTSSVQAYKPPKNSGISNYVFYSKERELYQGAYMSNTQTPGESFSSDSASIETFITSVQVQGDQPKQVNSPLSLTIFADDQVEVWRHNQTSNTSKKVATVNLGSPFQLNENGIRSGIFNTLVSKMIIPNFTNSDMLVFRVKNTGGPGYFIANWKWNDKQYGTNNSTLKVPVMSLVSKDKLSNKSVQQRFVTSGQYQGCYDDTDTNVPALTTSLGKANSIEECAVMAYGRMRDMNISTDYYYGLRNRNCHVGQRIGCGDVKPTVDTKCDVRLRNGFSEKSGRNNTMAIYKVSNKSMQFLSSPIYTLNTSDIPKQHYDGIRTNIDFETAKPIKTDIGLHDTNKSVSDMGFPDGYMYNRKGNPIKFSNNVVGFREYVWSPEPEYSIITKNYTCANPDTAEFNPQLFYDPETTENAKKSLRDSFYEISDEACGEEIKQNNILDTNMRDTVLDEINSAIEIAMTTTSYNSWQYASSKKYMVRIDDDAKVHCIASNSNAATCAMYDNKPDGPVDSTKTLQCSNYTRGSWCITALSDIYNNGNENLRFVGKFKKLLSELVILVQSYTDFSNKLKVGDLTTVDLNEYQSIAILDGIINGEDDSKKEELKIRLRNLLDKIYEFTNASKEPIGKQTEVVMEKLDKKKNTLANIVYQIYKYAQILNGTSRT